MPILCDSSVDESSVKMVMDLRMARLKPWADSFDPVTGIITWNAANMTSLETAISNTIATNDAILTNQGGDMKAAILKGWMPIEVYADGMPNLHTVRQVMYVFGGPLVKAIAARVPKEAFRQAFSDLNKVNQFKMITPKRTVS